MDGVPSTSTFGREDYSLGSGMRHSGSLDVAPSWQHNMHGGPILQHPPMQGHGRSVLLQELYDHELPPDHVSHSHGHHQQDAYYQHSAEPQYGHGGGDWSATPPSSSHGLPGSPHTLPPMRSAQDGMVRRNTFPYVRHDHDPNGHYGHDNGHHYVQQHPQMLPPFGRPDMMYGEPMPLHAVPGHMPLSAEPSALHAPRLDDGYGHMQHDDHHRSHPYHHGMHDGSVKLEEGGPVMITPQSGFYRPPSSGGMMPYLSPHTGLPIQHTDDAASKETQYLRRRCFNCHTTEPPSWRRSTLNPGKIVCNKCGLYERTHLRPRPLRFDELRAGNKARKAAAAKTSSPKQRVIKKEPGAGSDGIARRSSVSSTTSSSNGGSSDWDDNGKFSC
jgi:GATA-binding protein